jgi:hypothetical protein
MKYVSFEILNAEGKRVHTAHYKVNSKDDVLRIISNYMYSFLSEGDRIQISQESIEDYKNLPQVSEKSSDK